MFLGIVITMAFSCLSGLVLSLVALLPQVWRTGKKGIILSVSATYLAATLCLFLIFTYTGVITTITSQSYQMYHWDDFSKGEGGIGYYIDEKIHHNRDAIATELWNRQVIPHLQKHCFASDTTICDLADQIESRGQTLKEKVLLLALATIPAALACIATTVHLIKKQAAEMQAPEQQLAHIRRRKPYLAIPLILIWSCFALSIVSSPIFAGPAINSAMVGVAHPIIVYNGQHQVIKYADAPAMPGTTAWIGPWHLTLAPGVAIGFCLVVVIELVLVEVFKEVKAL